MNRWIKEQNEMILRQTRILSKDHKYLAYYLY